MMKKLKKAFWGVYVFLFILIIGTFSAQSVWDGTSATKFYSGIGTESDPYVILTETQLAYFAEQLNSGHTFAGEYLSLEANLDMTGGEWNVTSGQAFAGTFAGNNHTITINSRFLDSISEDGTVDWLNLIATEQLNTPLLCEKNYGSIQNCRVRGEVYIKPSSSAALLCTTNQSTGKVINSCGFGSVYGYGDDNDCYVGWISENDGIIKNCYTVLSLSGTATGRYNELYTGGITAKGTSENCYADSMVSANDDSFLALLNQTVGVSGYIWTTDNNVNDGYPVIKECLDAMTQLSVSSEPMFSYHSGALNTSITCTESGCTIYYTLDGSDPTVSNTRVVFSNSLMLSGDAVVTSVAYKNGKYSVPHTQYAIQLIGSGTFDDPYQISSNLGLYAIRFEPDKVYELIENLDFVDEKYIHNGILGSFWEAIPEFSGTLNGGRHSITGLASITGGLVNSNSGVIQELRLLDHQLCRKGRDYNNYEDHFGPVANSNSGTITRCYAAFDPNVTVYTDVMYNGVGGIVGYNSGKVSYCNSSGKIMVDAYESYSRPELAGIAGTNRGTIQSCYSDARVYMCYTSHDLGATVGGISVGGTVQDCRFDGYCEIDSYTASFGVGAAAFAGGRSESYRCYNGGATFNHKSTSGHKYFSIETDLYNTTYGSAKRMETSFPKFDFENIWMITEDGPMPQGVMNADGNYYTKKSYTAPMAYKNGETVCYVNGTDNVATFELSASGTVALSSETSECTVGDTIFVDITANAPFSAAEVALSYDTAYLIFNKSASSLNEATVNDINGIFTIIDYGDSKSSYTLAFDTITSGTAEIKFTSAAFGDAEDAASEDLKDAVITNDTVSITIVEPAQEVVLSDSLSGASSVEYGEDYTFSIVDYSEYYEYEVNATMADTSVNVINNGDGTYTIENVTGKLVITAECTPKEFYVVFETTTDVTLPDKSASVYGDDYTFTMPTQEHYSTDITQVSYMTNQINVPYTCENGVVTIKGKDIIDNIKIVIDQELTDAAVTVEGSGADDVISYEEYVTGGEAYSLTVTEDDKYDYAVTAQVNGEAVELTVGEGTYTILADDVKPGTIVFTITKTIKLDAVTVSEYLTLDGNKLWLIKNTVTELDGMVYRYDGANMFWSDTYEAYCAIVASSAKPDVTVNNLSLVSGEVLELTDTIDVNMSGKIDANDAQVVYNMYNGKYSGITDTVTVEKYFRADVNRDGAINTLDAAAVVNHILTRNTQMLFSRRSEPSFHFSLEADGSSEKPVQTGDVITFTFRLNRTDSAEDYIMYAMQNEIRYDSTVLELIEDSITVKENVTTTDILYSAPDRELYMNYLAKSGNDVWTADTLVGSFQMKVIGISGSTTVSCQDYSMSRADGMGSYPVTCSNVTLEITDVQTVYGDIDGDNQLTPSDLDSLAKYWAGYPGYSIKDIPLEVLDVDFDGVVTRRDAMILERHFAGWNGYESLPLRME